MLNVINYVVVSNYAMPVQAITFLLNQPVFFFVDIVLSLPDCLPDCAISKLFADDFKSYVPVSNVSAIDDFNNLLECISQWSIAWQLPL